MRKIGIFAVIILALGASAVILPASASQSASSGPRWLPRHGLSSNNVTPQAPSDAFTTNDNFVTVTFNHFGKPSFGSVVAETWLESGHDDTGTAVNAQGFSRAILLPKALRVAVQVDLHGLDATGGNDQVVAHSSAVNSSGRLTVQVATPEILLATSTKCSFYTVVHMAIRWSDNRLSTVVFDQPVAFQPGPTGACPAA